MSVETLKNVLRWDENKTIIGLKYVSCEYYRRNIEMKIRL